MSFLLDPKTTALVLIDLQHINMARQLAPHTSATVLANSVTLANTLRAAGGTVFFVRAEFMELLDLPVDAPFPRGEGAPPPNFFDLVPEAGIQPGDYVLTKRQWGAFYGTELEQRLRRRGIKTMVIGGIATNFGVESTAREAFDLGFEGVFAEEAMSC